MFVPWKPRYTRDEAAKAVAQSSSWADALRCLGLSPRGKNFATIRKWALRWELDVSHLPAYRPGVAAPNFSEQDLRTAISASRSWAETLRLMGRCPTGGNRITIKKWAAEWNIDTNHFDPHAAATEALQRRSKGPKPLAEVMVEESTYSRHALKERLYNKG